MHSGVSSPPNLWLVTIGNLKATSKLSIVHYILEVKIMLCGHGASKEQLKGGCPCASFIIQLLSPSLSLSLSLFSIFFHKQKK